MYIKYKVLIISLSYIIHASSLKCKLFRLKRGYNTFVKHIIIYTYIAIGLYLFYKAGRVISYDKPLFCDPYMFLCESTLIFNEKSE